MRNRVVLTAAVVAVVLGAPTVSRGQTPQGTAFTYQGRLTDGGTPANGTYDIQLILYDAVAGGSQVGPIVLRDDVAVASGLFTVTADFGAVFAGSLRWLEVAVRPGASGGAYTPLAPRQALSPAPAAIFGASTPWTGVMGKPPGFADNVDNDSGGTVTSVTAGSGLTGGTITGTGTLGVAFGGPGLSPTVSRSDHNHDAAYATASHNHLGGTWSGTAAVGLSVSTSGTRGLRGLSSSTVGIGVTGEVTAATGFGVGVRGASDSSTGTGVVGSATSATGDAWGVHGLSSSTSGEGVVGHASATTGATHGVRGVVDSPGGTAVRGTNTTSFGTAILGIGNQAVFGLGNETGVRGQGRRGVWGVSTGDPSGPGIGVRGESDDIDGYAGYFEGRLHTTSTLSKAAGSFKIDHPLDPENKYLYHSFVESPDMKNVYDGLVVTDAEGFATVDLPEWFEALNRDFRYQLTVLDEGESWVFAKVAGKVQGNRFRIRTSAPGVEVSWQVTGIRQDPFAEKHRIPVEEDKPGDERGTYLHPEAWGQPKASGLEEKRRSRDRSTMPQVGAGGTR